MPLFIDIKGPLMFYLRNCKLLFVWLFMLISFFIIIFYNPKQPLDGQIVLAAPRDIAPGVKDPYYISSIAMVWEPLIDVDKNGQIEGRLSTAWESSADFKVWTFKLRQGVYFHDETPFNADAVLANIERWKAMGRRNSTFYAFDINSIYPNLIEVKKIDDYTVQFLFEKSMPMLVERMIRFGSPIFSPKCFNKITGDFTGIAQGTGPFKILENNTGNSVILIKNEKYYGEKSKSKKIIIRNIPNASTRYSALKAEEIYGVVDIGAMPPSLTKALLQDNRFAITLNKNSINQQILINQSKWPLSDKRFIQALNLIINREVVVENYFNGQAQPNNNLLNNISPYYIARPLYYDAVKAKKLSKEVVGDLVIPMEFLIPEYGLSRYSYKEIAEYLQSVFSDINIELHIQILDGAAYKKLLTQGAYDFSIGTQGLPDYRPESILEPYMASDGRVNQLYHLNYKNDRANQLFNQLKNSLDLNQRNSIYQELQMIATEDPPVLTLANDYSALIYNKKLCGYEATTYGITLNKIQWSENSD